MFSSVCLLDNFILGCCLTRGTGEFELTSFITLVLQTNQLPKCASQSRKREVFVKPKLRPAKSPSLAVRLSVFTRNSQCQGKAHGPRRKLAFFLLLIS